MGPKMTLVERSEESVMAGSRKEGERTIQCYVENTSSLK